MNNHEQRKHKRFPFREDILVDGTRMCTSIDLSEEKRAKIKDLIESISK